MLRLFVAFEVPEEQKDSLSEAASSMTVPGARWTPRASWHVTLKFLGATEVDRLGEVTGIVDRAAASSQPATVSLRGVGAFPGFRRARVLWVGLDDPAGVLPALAAALDGGFAAAGFRAEARPWTPHLTLARFKTPAAVQLDPESVRLDASPFEVGEVVLFQSHVNANGAVYEPLRRSRLGPRRDL